MVISARSITAYLVRGSLNIALTICVCHAQVSLLPGLMVHWGSQNLFDFSQALVLELVLFRCFRNNYTLQPGLFDNVIE